MCSSNFAAHSNTTASHATRGNAELSTLTEFWSLPITSHYPSRSLTARIVTPPPTAKQKEARPESQSTPQNSPPIVTGLLKTQTLTKTASSANRSECSYSSQTYP